jgi:flagellin-like protein
MADRNTDRAVTPVVSTILLVAVAVILATVVATAALGFLESTDDPAPVVGQSSGELVGDVAGGGDQVVRINHEAGDTVPVTDIEVAVDATGACGKQGRLVDLPDNAVGYGTPDQIVGDDIFDDTTPDGGALDTSSDGDFAAGDTISFRLASGECTLGDGDQITVRLVHTPTNAVVVEQTLTADA